MNPTIAQHLERIKQRLEETIFPLLPEDATFAREQARFVVMSLDWVQSAYPHVYRYAVVENQACRRTLGDLLALMTDSLSQDTPVQRAAQALAESGPRPEEAEIPLAQLHEQTLRMKSLVSEFYDWIAERGDDAHARARELLVRSGRQQVEREAALFASTGYTTSALPLGAVLGEKQER